MKKATTIQYIPAIFIKQRAMPGNKTPPLLMGEGASQQEQCKANELQLAQLVAEFV